MNEKRAFKFFVKRTEENKTYEYTDTLNLTYILRKML